MDYIKKRLILVYYDNIDDGHYILWFAFMTSVVLNDNPSWPWILNMNENLVLHYFHESDVVNGL